MTFSYVHARDCGLPLLLAQAGSLRYGSSHRIMDWMDIKTYGETLKDDGIALGRTRLKQR